MVKYTQTDGKSQRIVSMFHHFVGLAFEELKCICLWHSFGNILAQKLNLTYYLVLPRFHVWHHQQGVYYGIHVWYKRKSSRIKPLLI